MLMLGSVVPFPREMCKYMGDEEEGSVWMLLQAEEGEGEGDMRCEVEEEEVEWWR